MTIRETSLEAIEDFLAQKRIAIVGVSRDPASLSVSLFKEFSGRGYDVVPINPNLAEVQGQKCFARLQDVQPAVDAALLMTSPDVTNNVVCDCAESGVRRVWMYSDGRRGALSEQALEFCQAKGIRVIPGQCPFMFLPNAGGIHRFHGFIRKITGRFPHRSAA